MVGISPSYRNGNSFRANDAKNKGGETLNKKVDETGGTFESLSKSDPLDRVSEGSSSGYSKSDDHTDIGERQQQWSPSEGILNERNDNSSPAKEGTDSVEEDQLSQDKGDDNVGMEDEDIAGELERNLEQVSDTHMLDLEPLPSGPSNEKAPKLKKRKGTLDCDAPNENLKRSPELKKSKDIVQGEPNNNLKQSPKPKKSKDIVQDSDPNEKVRKPDKGNAIKLGSGLCFDANVQYHLILRFEIKRW
ncbi:hypothetical protein LWI29_012111 [Acer saccharum]|uniref:Uncharacterized protein n=1 Tax=Acer saccharum TaxID=4024 RepID=A0AA39TE01_ACESA|nr:hypothetical protein LWI29_012111 [Acer saccharum]